jgi:uncharacterized protein (DUF2147 family)
MKIKMLALLLGCFVLGAHAQMTPVGLWRTIDDDTQKPKAEIRILQNDAGVVSGVIEKSLITSDQPNCNLCTDDRKDQPKVGMEIIRGAKKTEGKDVWEDGTILDPEKGKSYTLRMTPIEGGSKLQVRGYIGFFFRTQTWIRIQ